jgi:hypothetical protein
MRLYLSCHVPNGSQLDTGEPLCRAAVVPLPGKAVPEEPQLPSYEYFRFQNLLRILEWLREKLRATGWAWLL